MRLIFAGTPIFAAKALEALLSVGHDIVLVLTQPDRPAGRGLKLVPSDVKKIALKQNLRVEQPLTLKTPEALALVAEARADAMIVAAYGLILPKAVLGLPRLGCINIHGSLLPRWRGAAPIQRAILAGDAETGVTIMQMDAGLDTGAMLHEVRTPITSRTTGGDLHDRLAIQGANALIHVLDNLDNGSLEATPQPDEGVTYAAKISKDEAKLDFALPAIALWRKVRAEMRPGSRFMV